MGLIFLIVDVGILRFVDNDYWEISCLICKKFSLTSMFKINTSYTILNKSANALFAKDGNFQCICIVQITLPRKYKNKQTQENFNRIVCPPRKLRAKSLIRFL